MPTLTSRYVTLLCRGTPFPLHKFYATTIPHSFALMLATPALATAPQYQPRTGLQMCFALVELAAYKLGPKSTRWGDWAEHMVCLLGAMRWCLDPRNYLHHGLMALVPQPYTGRNGSTRIVDCFIEAGGIDGILTNLVVGTSGFLLRALANTLHKCVRDTQSTGLLYKADLGIRVGDIINALHVDRISFPDVVAVIKILQDVVQLLNEAT